MSDTALALGRFLPYRLSLVANRVSRGLAQLYAQRFNLTIPQWRVIAVLAGEPGISADRVCALTAMDKVAVSRAVARLAARRYLTRRRDPSDGRRVLLSLSAAGRRVHGQIVPLARAYEAGLLAQLGGVERDLARVLDALETATAPERVSGTG